MESGNIHKISFSSKNNSISHIKNPIIKKCFLEIIKL